ncbi:MAG: disulfide isomerase DsbC N-terminal domain-containing protein [Dissulfurispiraceae bacterium]
MNKILFPLLVFLLLFPIAYAYSTDTKCETLTKDEATAILRNLDPKVSAIDVRTSPAEGMWEVTVNTGAKKILAYIDCSKRYVILGNLIDTKEKKNLTQERLTEINKVDVSSIPLDDALVMGDKSAPHKLIVFDDPE